MTPTATSVITAQTRYFAKPSDRGHDREAMLHQDGHRDTKARGHARRITAIPSTASTPPAFFAPRPCSDIVKPKTRDAGPTASMTRPAILVTAVGHDGRYVEFSITSSHRR
jgi:hypothetical protein